MGQILAIGWVFRQAAFIYWRDWASFKPLGLEDFLLCGSLNLILPFQFVVFSLKPWVNSSLILTFQSLMHDSMEFFRTILLALLQDRVYLIETHEVVKLFHRDLCWIPITTTYLMNNLVNVIIRLILSKTLVKEFVEFNFWNGLKWFVLPVYCYSKKI